MAIDAEKIEEPKSPEKPQNIPADWKANIIRLCLSLLRFCSRRIWQGS